MKLLLAEAMAQEGLQLDEATEADEEQVLQLINVIQPHVPWSREHLRWQFFGPPGGRARIYVARSEGAIISLYVAVPHVLSLRGELHRSFMVQDVMTRADFRGRGLLHEFGRRCLADIREAGDYGHTFPNDLSEKSFRRLGWSELCRVPLRKLQVSNTAPTSKAFVVEPWGGKFDAGADAIWTHAGLDIGVRRDASYLEWRYSRPDTRYLRYRLAGGEGLLVLKPYEGTERVVHVCELIVPAMNRALLKEALAFTMEVAREHRAGSVTAWLPEGHPYADSLDEAGLTLATPNRFVFVTAPEQALARITSARSWHLTHGDSDVY